MTPDAARVMRLADDCVTNINEGYTTISGWTREDVIGKRSIETDLWVKPDERQNILTQLQKQGYYQNHETVLKRKDGARFAAILSCRLFFISRHTPCYYAYKGYHRAQANGGIPEVE
jgi:two-component system, cell cycle sensor histidine kinase and response regulator CckA